MEPNKRVQEITAKPKHRRHGTRRGFFHPSTPVKYEGNVQSIIYRSGIELRLMKYMDTHPSVLKWSSEETIIPYVSPIDKKVHRYFVDFKVTTQQKDGTKKIHLVEMKWSTQMREPKKPKKQTRRYLNEVRTWIVNNAKWDAAKKVCAEKGWEWNVINEKQLGL